MPRKVIENGRSLLVRMSGEVFDILDRAATDREMTISAIIRATLRKEVSKREYDKYRKQAEDG